MGRERVEKDLNTNGNYTRNKRKQQKDKWEQILEIRHANQIEGSLI